MSVHDAREVAGRLVGTYRLLAMSHFTDDGEVGHPFGLHPRGFMIYTAEGYMSAILMHPDRAPFAGGDILGGTDEEKLAAFASSSAYAGRWEIVGDQIVHHLEATSFPNWTGTDQARDFELTDAHLSLFPPPLMMEGKLRRSRVDFERIARP